MKTLLLTIISITSFIFSQGEYAVPFLLISPDAHSSALGESGVSFPETPGLAMHFNTAGIAYQRKYGDSFSNKSSNPLGFSYASWLPNLGLSDLWYLHAASTFGLGASGDLGISLRYLNLGEVVTTDAKGNPTNQNYTAKEFEFSVAYSTEIKENSFIGVAAKFIYSGITTENVTVGGETNSAPASSVAFDLGYYTILGSTGFLKDVRFGASWNNVGANMTYVDKGQSDPLPTIFKAGLAANIVQDDKNRLRFNYDLGLFTLLKQAPEAKGGFFDSLTHSLGLEFTYDNAFVFRTGAFMESDKHGARKFMTLGVGFNAEVVVVDISYLVALNDGNHPLNGTTRFSLRYQL